jgi:hypothetical protein
MLRARIIGCLDRRVNWAEISVVASGKFDNAPNA